jgi:hypothetical protein
MLGLLILFKISNGEDAHIFLILVVFFSVFLLLEIMKVGLFSL